MLLVYTYPAVDFFGINRRVLSRRAKRLSWSAKPSSHWTYTSCSFRAPKFNCHPRRELLKASAKSDMTSADKKAEELDKICDKLNSLKFRDCPEKRPRELWDLMKSEPTRTSITVIDVRRSEEREVSFLPSSIACEDFSQNKELYRDKQIYCYCTVGFRSGMYARNLRKEGFDAYNLRGSILAWTQEGLPVFERKGESEVETKQVHTFSKQWQNLVGDGFSAKYFKLPFVKVIGDVLGGLW